MRNAYHKDIGRTILKEKKRLIALMIITALGVAMLCGLKAACDDLRAAADQFFDLQNLHDLEIVSTLGLTDSDVQALEQLDMVREAQGIYSENVKVEIPGGKRTALVKTFLPDGIDRPYLVEGSLPQTSDEIAVTAGYLTDTGKRIGDTVTLLEDGAESEVSGEDAEVSAAGADPESEADSFPAEEAAVASEDEDSDDDEPDFGAVDDYEGYEEDDGDPNFPNPEFTITAVIIDPSDVTNPDGSTAFRNTGINAYTFFVRQEAVDSDVYTGVLLTAQGTDELNTFSGAYEEKTDRLTDYIETRIKESRQKARYDEVIGEANQKLSDARKDMDEAFAEADEKLADAREELDDGWKELEDGERTLERESADAWRKIADAKQELADGRRELDDGWDQLVDAYDQIREGQEQLDENEALLNEKEQELNAGAQQIAEAKAELQAQEEAAIAQLDGGIAEIESQLPGVQEMADAGVEGAAEMLAGLQEQLAALQAQKSAAQEGFAQGYARIAENEAQIEAGRAQLEAGRAQIEAGREELTEGVRKFLKGRSQLEKAETELADGEKTLAEEEAKARREIADAKQELIDGRSELEDGEEEYEDGLAKYNDKKEEAEEKLQEAQDKIDDIDMTAWYIRTRTSLDSFHNITSDADSIQAVATAIPIMFFVIAILISLTTITRMVEENRGLIGTYQALGFTDREIRRKFMVYSAAASLFGGLLGNLLGFIALPQIIIIIFKTMYLIPEYRLLFTPVTGVGGTFLFLGGILAATYITCEGTLKQMPAQLMRPKPPRNGSRILLERAKGIWSRLSFLNKVTARNLFRYKKRMLMTIFGIAGCMGLLITGFSVKDTVADLMPKQYGRINRYEMLVAANTAQDLEDLEESIHTRESEGDEIAASITGMQNLRLESVKLMNRADEELTVQLYVIPEGESLAGYMALMTPEGDPVEIAGDGFYVTKNAADVLKLSIGDQVRLQDQALDIAGGEMVCEVQYYLGNCVFMTESVYLESFDKGEPEKNALLLHLREGTLAKESAELKDWISGQSGIASVSNTDELKATFSQAFALINMVVYIIVIMAAALAFVVLFTLSTTNISERERELATIKVLGFYDSEVHRYVNKETMILTGIGIAAGVPLGIFFAEMLALVLSLPSINYETSIHGISYVICAGLSLVFALAVNFITNKSLNRIDPVEALKSVE